MEPKKIALIALGGLGVAASAFAGSRYLLRNEVQLSIEESEGYSRALVASKAMSLVGIDIGLPSPEELAGSLVPIVSTVSPYEAAEDIVVNGRASRFWPEAYRRSDIPPQIEQLLMRVMVNLAQQEDQIA